MNANVECVSEVPGTPFVEQWYEFADLSHFWMQWRFHALLKLLKGQGLNFESRLTAMDIGAGNGAARQQLERVTQWVIDCVDLNYTGLSQMPKGRGRTIFYDILERRAEYQRRYDLVFALDVIEHIEPTKPFIEAAASHLSPGGLLVINVPALHSMYSEYDRQVGHHRRYSKHSLTQAVREAGLEPVELRYWGALLVPVLAVRKALLAMRKTGPQTVRTGFQPPASWINEVFKKLATLETAVWSNPPVGSSLLLVAKHTV